MAGAVAGMVARADANAAADPEEPALRFVVEGGRSTSLTLSELRSACEPLEVAVDDPYHGRRMRYVGLPLHCVLDRGFRASGGVEAVAGEGLLLRARDGYTRSVRGRTLLEPGGVIAYGEPERLDSARPRAASPFSPIDRRQVDPAPFYLVWSGLEQSDPHRHPWPYQLETIEVVAFESAFPHTVPEGLAASDPGWRGYAIFQRACSSCHAINGEGGKVGPELNVPQSIVEYRGEDQIKAYVRDPQQFRYTSMPAHPGLDDADLDALIAYFRAMQDRKHDPGAGGGP